MSPFDETSSDTDGAAAFADLKQHIVEITGLAYYLDKDAELASHIGRRLETLHLSDWGTYREILLDPCAGPAELDELTISLTNGETFFFRHQELFDALRDQIIPEMIARNRTQRRLRIWSAGCANGAEPYSLSILLQREFASQLAGWDVSMIGTDINREFLLQGERGEFSDWSLRSMAADLQASCFRRSGSTWTINETYRRGVRFRCHNLVQDPFPALAGESAALDLILCRNVMIYFAPPIVQRLVGQFHDCLVPGGWLAVGPAEPNVGLFQAFETVNAAGTVLYRRRQRMSLTPAGSRQTPSGMWPLTTKATVCPRMLAGVPGEAGTRATLGRRSTAAVTAGDEPAPMLQQALAEARQKLDLGDNQAVVDCCHKLLALDRLNPLVHFYHALAAQYRGRHGEAEQALRRAIYLDRDFVLAHYQLGLVLLRRQDVCGAGRSFRNVLAILHGRDEDEQLPDADGLTVKALEQLTEMQMEILNCT